MDNKGNDACIAGHCRVHMAKGKFKRVDRIVKGDVLDNGAKVVCVVKTRPKDCVIKMVNISGGGYGNLLVTPWHPVQLDDGMWRFPNTFREPEDHACAQIYSFALDTIHMMKIENVTCVTMGHDFEDEVRCHPFFGSPRVVETMRSFPGFEDGLIETCGTKRDKVTGLVNGFMYATSYTLEHEIPKEMVESQPKCIIV